MPFEPLETNASILNLEYFKITVNNLAKSSDFFEQIILKSLSFDLILEDSFANVEELDSDNLSQDTKSSEMGQHLQTSFEAPSSLNEYTLNKNDIIDNEQQNFKVTNKSAPTDSEMFILPLAIATSISATQPMIYYISPSGNDKNSGTSPTSAWRSLSKVNSRTFAPGDQILLEGGSTFTGQLYFDANDGGSASNPITIGSYGGNPATINAGTKTGIFIYNSAGYQISNLNLVGSGITTNTGQGINFYNNRANKAKLDGITINNVEVSGFNKYGVSIGSWNNQSGYRNVKVTNVLTHNNGGGLISYAQIPNTHENIYVRNVRAYNNQGNGILLGGVNTGIVERSIAHDNVGPGIVGIWSYDSTNITIQYNESYNNRTTGGTDGGGFDLDQDISNSIMQYNYSHGNDGAGFLLAQGINNQNHTGNVVRYNISQNDGRKNGHAAIDVYGPIKNAEIYHNTVFLSPAPTGKPVAMRVWNPTIENLKVSGLHIRNNNFVTTNGLRLVDVSSSQVNGSTDFLFQGNNYYSTGASFNITWNGKIYSSLNSWRTATNQEKIGTQDVGLSVNPLILQPGGGETLGNPDLLNTLDAYQLGSTSPLIDQGLDLGKLFNINPGTQDFQGTALPQGIGYDIGADEF